jgi:hypothetical protein
MMLQGFYSVASAPTGRLQLVISNHNGIVNVVGDQRIVSAGAPFLLSMTFTMPPNTTQLCRAADLTVGGRQIHRPPPGPSIISCLDVLP